MNATTRPTFTIEQLKCLDAGKLRARFVADVEGIGKIDCVLFASAHDRAVRPASIKNEHGIYERTAQLDPSFAAALLAAVGDLLESGDKEVP